MIAADVDAATDISKQVPGVAGRNQMQLAEAIDLILSRLALR